MEKGKKIYVPPAAIAEVQDIMAREKTQRATAFKEMAVNSRLGRELKRIMHLDWGK